MIFVLNICHGNDLIFDNILGNQRLNILKDVNSQLTLRVPRHEDRIEKLHRYVNGLKVKQEKQKEAVDRKREQLKKVIRTAAKQLIQYIFPLSKVQPNKRYIYPVKQKYILRYDCLY